MSLDFYDRSGIHASTPRMVSTCFLGPGCRWPTSTVTTYTCFLASTLAVSKMAGFSTIRGGVYFTRRTHQADRSSR